MDLILVYYRKPVDNKSWVENEIILGGHSNGYAGGRMPGRACVSHYTLLCCLGGNIAQAGGEVLALAWEREEIVESFRKYLAIHL